MPEYALLVSSLTISSHNNFRIAGIDIALRAFRRPGTSTGHLMSDQQNRTRSFGRSGGVFPVTQMTT